MEFWSSNQQIRQNEFIIKSSLSDFLQKQEKRAHKWSIDKFINWVLMPSQTLVIINNQSYWSQILQHSSRCWGDSPIFPIWRSRRRKENEVDAPMLPLWGSRNWFHQKSNFENLWANICYTKYIPQENSFRKNIFFDKETEILILRFPLYISTKKLSWKLMFQRIWKEVPFSMSLLIKILDTIPNVCTVPYNAMHTIYVPRLYQ